MSTTLATNRSTFAAGRSYLLLSVLLLGSWLVSWGMTRFLGVSVGEKSGATMLVFFSVSAIIVFGFLAYEIAKRTIIPSFVIAIFIGMLERDLLAPLMDNATLLSVLTTLGAVIILFDGGLDMPFVRFRSLIFPILSVSFLGTVLTSVAFSFLLVEVAALFGVFLPLPAVALCSMALAPTDPSAIIPSFKALKFSNPRVKDIAISGSAISEVVAAVLLGLMLESLASLAGAASLPRLYAFVFSGDTLGGLAKEMSIGTAVGMGGFLMLHVWSEWKRRFHTSAGEADAALFLAMPLLCYAVAYMFGGSGFLAVFVSSLLFQMRDHTQHVEGFLAHTVEGFMKPLIFILLGAMIDLPALMDTAGIGIVMALLFMLVLRPLIVLVTLGPFLWTRTRLTWRELGFLCFVRETGVIPAVLLISLLIAGVPGAREIVDIGLWVILLTLVVQPPLTPLVARLLGVAEIAPPLALVADEEDDKTAVLCSRSKSFLGRMPTVVEWASQHNIGNVTLLHCPEDRYSDIDLRDIEEQASSLFLEMNEALRVQGGTALKFHFVSRPGPLQDNILELLTQKNVSIVFVGKKMLDYRLSDIKNLPAPFVFLP